MNTKQPKRNGLTNDQGGARKSSRRGTGPRTAIGKERAKYNALKHGLFAKAILLPHEDPSQFNDLLSSLQRDYGRTGTMERLLLEEFATTCWRKRRFLQAERANLQKNIEAQEEDNAGFSPRALHNLACVQKEEAETNRKGGLPEIDNSPESLEYCLEKLNTVAEDADRYGLEHSAHKINLGLVYGARYSGRPGNDLFDYYLDCCKALKASAPDRARKGFESEVDCVKKFVAETEKEIHRLEGHRKSSARKSRPRRLAAAHQPIEMGLLEMAIPDSHHLDRLLRVEANLERAFDRVLAHLEQLQRIRAHQRELDLLTD